MVNKNHKSKKKPLLPELVNNDTNKSKDVLQREGVHNLRSKVKKSTLQDIKTETLQINSKNTTLPLQPQNINNDQNNNWTLLTNDTLITTIKKQKILKKVKKVKKPKTNLKRKRGIKSTKKQRESWDKIINDIATNYKPKFEQLPDCQKENNHDSLLVKINMDDIKLQNCDNNICDNSDIENNTQHRLLCSGNQIVSSYHGEVIETSEDFTDDSNNFSDNVLESHALNSKANDITVLSNVLVNPETKLSQNKMAAMDGSPRKKYEVEIFTNGYDVDFSTFLEILDPDCMPVFYRTPRFGFPEWGTQLSKEENVSVESDNTNKPTCGVKDFKSEFIIPQIDGDDDSTDTDDTYIETNPIHLTQMLKQARKRTLSDRITLGFAESNVDQFKTSRVDFEVTFQSSFESDTMNSNNNNDQTKESIQDFEDGEFNITTLKPEPGVIFQRTSTNIDDTLHDPSVNIWNSLFDDVVLSSSASQSDKNIDLDSYSEFKAILDATRLTSDGDKKFSLKAVVNVTQIPESVLFKHLPKYLSNINLESSTLTHTNDLMHSDTSILVENQNLPKKTLVMDKKFEQNCFVNLERLPQQTLNHALNSTVYLPKDGDISTVNVIDRKMKVKNVKSKQSRYSLRSCNKIPQLDGCDDDEVSSSDDDDKPITKALIKSKDLTLRQKRPSTPRGGSKNKIFTIKSDDVQYPMLDITVSQSPVAAFKDSPRSLRKMAATSPRRSKQMKATKRNILEKEFAASASVIDFGNQTLMEDKIECRYRATDGHSENVMALSQLKEQILLKSSTMDHSEKSEVNPAESVIGVKKLGDSQIKFKEIVSPILGKQVEIETLVSNKLLPDEHDDLFVSSLKKSGESQSSNFEKNDTQDGSNKFNQNITQIISISKESQDSHSLKVSLSNEITEKLPVVHEKMDVDESDQSDASNNSDELFVSSLKTISKESVDNNTKLSDKESNLTVPSSLEALITPYQENQPPDDVMLMSYNSQTNLFEDSLPHTEETHYTSHKIQKSTEVIDIVNKSINKLVLTKAEEYDIANKIVVVPGPSSHPSSFESIIRFESTTPQTSQNDNLTPNFLDTLNHSPNNNQSVSVLDLTLHLDVNDSTQEEPTISLDGTDRNKNNTMYAYITPKFKPPSYKLVSDTLHTYKILEYKNTDPYYSDEKHVTGAVDVGFNTLRILLKNYHQDFKSSFKSLSEYQKLLSGANNLKDFQRLKLSYCTGKSMFVTPVTKPPSVKEVKLWLLKKKHSRRLGTNIKIESVDVGVKGENIVDMEETCKEVQDHDSTMLGLGLSNESDNKSEVTSPKLNKSSWHEKSTDLIDNSHLISGVSLNNTHGFKMTLENLQEARSLDIYQYITSLTMELHADCRGDKLPDPQIDSVQIIFFALANDVPEISTELSSNLDSTLKTPETQDNLKTEPFLKGFICVDSSDASCSTNILTGTGIVLSKYTLIVPDELSLFKKFLELYHTWNPDILMGYEIEHSSWGYLIERGYVLGLNMPVLLSRLKDPKPNKAPTIEDISQNRDQEEHSHIKIPGRIVLDLWRILKHEIALQSYTFENLAYHVLHERVPHYAVKDLSRWWNHKICKYRHRTVDYYLYRVEGCFRLIDHYDLIGRTAELARLFGILFYEVLSRGSQFRVESMMLRLAKPYKYVPVSPSVQQRATMKAPEFLPLILEPESKFYKDPVIVLDFQSLYPSIIIGYNYCFSTCLGRVEHLCNSTDGKFEFGAYELEVSRKLIAKYLKANFLTISPCGVAFVKDVVRPGIMPRMLREILDTRLMVKKSMKSKQNKGNKTLQKVLHSRQLGLKLIANVTYGYTAANFSGRMPACELADSVVSKGRETLQRAINMVEKHPTWGARVVYGDTDSMFVLCEGKSREQAFCIGEEIVEAVTNANPSPVKLKLEKVYQPCILQTKKRYVGYMYESKEQKVPEFEAKGIETVRRDGCPAASKMLEKCLKLLFDNRDVSQVRNYVLKQFNKILTGRVSIQDLTFAKEYRGKEGYRPGACVPALVLTRKWMSVDARKEPRSGERVPYIIVNGPPGLPLIKLVKSPHDLLEDSSLRPNALYYITKAIIPPINRCFKLIGADLFTWFNEMPRKQVQYLHVASPSKGPKSTISQYFATAACASCSVQTKEGLCPKCRNNPQGTIVNLHRKIYMWERNYFTCKKVCETCCVRTTDLPCNSLDCPVLYRSKQTIHDLQQTDFVRSLFDYFPEDNNTNLL